MTAEPRRPGVVAFLGFQTLGDFCWQALTAASVAAALGGARLGLIYRDDCPYKTPLVAMTPLVSASLALPASAALPLDWFDPGCPHAAWPDAWVEQELHRPDLFLTPAMMAIDCTMPPMPGMNIPPRMEAPLRDRLCRLGLDPARWFACVHMREIGYAYRRGLDKDRCVDPLTYLPMIRDILEQGGQVVRLGDPSMTPLPRLPGLIDLSRIEDAFLLQACAVSHARFFVGTDSGATQLAASFKTPAATTNALGFGVWNDGDVMLPKTIHAADGHRLSLADIRSTNMTDLLYYRLPGGRVEDNTPEQLVAVARHMHRITADCTGWRQPRNEVTLGNLTLAHLPLRRRGLSEERNITWWDPAP